MARHFASHGVAVGEVRSLAGPRKARAQHDCVERRRAASCGVSTMDHHNIPLERIAALHAIRDRHPGTVGAPQRARLLDALQTLGHVTTFEGSRHLDCYDVRARKMELVKAGHDITTTWRITETESGDRHRIGVYTLNRSSNQMAEA